ALSNLIDNALKYGREAEVAVDGDADDAWITVTDRGSVLTGDDLDRLTGAFQRGRNSADASGVGLGLAIVSTVASQHGGDVRFQRADSGLSARLQLCRFWS
ncbi:sensor histidine kinase, partial [Paracoccus sp. YLB-12]